MMIIATNSPTTIYIAFTPPSTGVTVIVTDTVLVELEVAVDTHTHTQSHNMEVILYMQKLAYLSDQCCS